MENNLLYTYFKPILKQEHYLFAGEIAEKYGIYTRTDKVADSFVSAYLKEIAIKTKGYEQLYYSTRYGMSRVYPYNFYNAAMVRLIQKIGYNNETKIVVDNKNYYIKVVK